ncbi:MAG: BON domain-containing protein [bacterium]
MSEKLQMNIQNIIDDDPTTRGRNIVVEVKKKGFWGRKKFVHLIGNVDNDKQKQRAEEIAKMWAGGIEVVNDIEVNPYK